MILIIYFQVIQISYLTLFNYQFLCHSTPFKASTLYIVFTFFDNIELTLLIQSILELFSTSQITDNFLPAPLGPKITTISPCLMEKDASLR